MLAPRRFPAAAFIIALFFVSGAAGLVYEVVWMQMLAVTLGGTAPAVAAVLAAFMGGLALGSALGGRLVDRFGRPLLWYAGLELFVGLYALALRTSRARPARCTSCVSASRACSYWRRRRQWALRRRRSSRR
jgi:predicted MFS family arabinose efflux permease